MTTPFLFVCLFATRVQNNTSAFRSSSSMGSLDQFSSKDFDPKTFINGLCESKPEDASLDRYDRDIS